MSPDTSGTEHNYRHMGSDDYTALEDELDAKHTEACRAKVKAEKQLDALETPVNDNGEHTANVDRLKAEIDKRQLEIGLINSRFERLDDKRLKYDVTNDNENC